MTIIENFIDNQVTKSFSKDLLPVYDPSTGEECSKVVLSNEKDFNNRWCRNNR